MDPSTTNFSTNLPPKNSGALVSQLHLKSYLHISYCPESREGDGGTRGHAIHHRTTHCALDGPIPNPNHPVRTLVAASKTMTMVLKRNWDPRRYGRLHPCCQVALSVRNCSHEQQMPRVPILLEGPGAAKLESSQQSGRVPGPSLHLD